MKRLVLVALLFAIILANSCGGNCPSGTCPTCYCGSTSNVQDIATWCAKHSWNQNCCKCIVSHESSGNANAMYYNPNGSTDVGIWQINSVRVGLVRSTGQHATAATLPVTVTKILHALLGSTTLPDRAGGLGRPTQRAAADSVGDMPFRLLIITFCGYSSAGFRAAAAG